VAEVAAAAGFGSASAFARAYRARFGESPTAARGR
jgi:transcriptional regulator GlxA family with amidase domain